VVDDLLAVQLGLSEAAAEAGCRLLGGDVSAIDGPLVIDVCAGGTVQPGRALRRDRGNPGDVLAVTGWLGRAAAGLRLLGGDPRAGEAPDAELWHQAQLRPQARVSEGLYLVGCGVGCAGDLSDGLLVDATRTAAASGCAAELWVDRLPVDRSLRNIFPDIWLELAVGGGEDFELLVAAPSDVLEACRAGWPAELAPLTVVGRLVAGSGVRLLGSERGSELPAPAVRSRHFG
jgi:thiamine-monophosphate kinase